MNTEQKEPLLQSKKNEYYRFKLMQGQTAEDGTFQRTKTVGMAYLVDGKHTYSLRLWTLLKDKFYLVPRKNDQALFLLVTRDWNKNPSAKNKTFSNIVGNGKADAALGVVKIEFDLLDKPIYMSIHPESFAQSTRLPVPEVLDEAA
ncbi:MAG: hypothetical protein SGJ18_00920 [Pseudomonadota bacterium]|nr:hypothetical protein [Pseudomonadota bacterium]